MLPKSDPNEKSLAVSPPGVCHFVLPSVISPSAIFSIAFNVAFYRVEVLPMSGDN